MMVFMKDIFRNRRMLLELTKNDFRAKYLGSLFGTLWAFVHPAITILVFCLVFQFGFRAVPVGDFPYAVWLISGITAWFFFSECLGSGTQSIVDNSFLVKKVAFRVSLLPIIKLLTALSIHLLFIVIVILINWIYGYKPSVYTLQLFYYIPALVVLLLGLTWFTSSIYVFFKDISQIITIILSLGFWVTPIFWSFHIVPERFEIFFKFNPMVYIVEGYRGSLIYHEWFWSDGSGMFLFWIEALLLLFIGAMMFRKLRPQFSDVI